VNGAAAVSVVEYGNRRVLLVIGIMMAALLQTLDATIVNVALPTIEGNIGAGIDDGTWIITGYIISNVVAIPLAPFLLQRLGRRQYYSGCIIGFTLASVLCGTAHTLPELVFFRIVQGAFGGGLIATSQIILRDTFPPEKVGSSAALFGIALTFGPALGPTLGGLLTDNLSWQWVFDINLVPGLFSAFIVLSILRNPAPPRRIPLDGLGIALLAVGLGSVQYVLDEGERNDWFDDSRVATFGVTAVIGLTLFVIWELRGAKTPIIDLRVFRYSNVRVGTLSAVLMGMVIFGPTVILPQYVQGVLAFTATLSGVLILLRALPVLVLTPLIGRIVSRVDPRYLIVTGFLMSATAFAALFEHMTTGSDFGSFAWLLVYAGVGQSLLFVPLLVSILGTIAVVDSPKVSSFLSLSFQLGGSVSSTMLVTAFDRRTYFHSDIFRGSARQSSGAVQALQAHHATLAQLSRAIQLQATNAGFADAVAILAPISLVGAALVLLLRPAKRGGATAARPVVIAAE
jgi:DHA2 family multidrug resistance protein